MPGIFSIVDFLPSYNASLASCVSPSPHSCPITVWFRVYFRSFWRHQYLVSGLFPLLIICPVTILRLAPCVFSIFLTPPVRIPLCQCLFLAFFRCWFSIPQLQNYVWRRVYFLFLDASQCMPVFVSSVLMFPGMGLSYGADILDIREGIQNPDIFNPPSYCPKQFSVVSQIYTRNRDRTIAYHSH